MLNKVIEVWNKLLKRQFFLVKTGGGKAADIVWIRINGKRYRAICGCNLKPGEAIAIKEDSGNYWLFGESPEQFTDQSRNLEFRKILLTKKAIPQTGSLKVLFFNESGNTVNFYVGGDREVPLLIHSVPNLASSISSVSPFIANTGLQEADFWATIGYSVLAQIMVASSERTVIFTAQGNPSPDVFATISYTGSATWQQIELTQTIQFPYTSTNTQILNFSEITNTGSFNTNGANTYPDTELLNITKIGTQDSPFEFKNKVTIAGTYESTFIGDFLAWGGVNSYILERVDWKSILSPGAITIFENNTTYVLKQGETETVLNSGKFLVLYDNTRFISNDSLVLEVRLDTYLISEFTLLQFLEERILYSVLTNPSEYLLIRGSISNITFAASEGWTNDYPEYIKAIITVTIDSSVIQPFSSLPPRLRPGEGCLVLDNGSVFNLFYKYWNFQQYASHHDILIKELLTNNLMSPLARQLVLPLFVHFQNESLYDFFAFSNLIDNKIFIVGTFDSENDNWIDVWDITENGNIQYSGLKQIPKIFSFEGSVLSASYYE